MKITSLIFGLILTFLASLAYGTIPSLAEQNKKTVLEFYNAALNQKNFDLASQYLGTRYTQHNPAVADGQTGLKNFITFLKLNFPQSHSEIKRVFTDGNYVILQVHSVRVPGTKGRAIIDIFKLKNAKIVEHWDVIQSIPSKTANTNGMF